MKKILIDYEGGTHGHFLEFVLNALDSSDDTLINSDPFSLSDRGTCRRRIYEPWSLRFCADHYKSKYKLEQRKLDIDAATDCIFIRLKPDFSDAILALRIALTRADPSVDLSDCEKLHNNFFNKVNDGLILSQYIHIIERYEKINLSIESPDLDYYQLRHFFTNHSFHRDNTRYLAYPFYKDKTITDVWFIDFYSWATFLELIKMLSKKFNLVLTDTRIERLNNLHTEFLFKNPCANDQGYQKCQQVLDNLDSCDPMPDLDIIEQSWLCASMLEFNGNFYYPHDEFFKTPAALKEYVGNLKSNLYAGSNRNKF